MGLSKEPVVILGAFRSGTSCLAAALNHLGVYLGNPEHFLPADQFNEQGYCELEELQMLNARALAIFGMNYFQAGKLPNDWLDVPGSREIVREIRGFLTREFSGKARWGWKEPSTTILMPLFNKALQAEDVSSPHYPISIRHPLSVAASQRGRQQRFGYPEPELTNEFGEPPAIEQRTVGLWLHYTLSALKETQGSSRQVFAYESFLSDPRPYLERLIRDMSGWNPSNEEMEAAIASVNPKLSHSKFSHEDLAGLPPLVGRVYDCCLAAQQDPDGLNAGKFDTQINEMWDEWIYTSQLTDPLPLPYSDMFFSWKDGGRASAKFTASSSWQKIRVTIDAPGGTTVQIDPSKLPCQIWIRNAVWRVDGKELQAAIRPGINGIVEDFGALRLTLYGPAPLLTQAPPSGPAEFEMEFRVVTGYAVMVDIIGKLQATLDRAKRAQAGRQVMPGPQGR